ncbi:LysR family transcriptional regulator [Paenibacillus sp. IHB B 3415]|uniref:LysR family transcriptional regulator n=1 Tax=Paenibacillus sp. IHB B 3415 TaxID=867080 RepID=UPI000574F1EA|nr:LysR family transcriptional regulator [Paenibacillus sp. IHB B 3415]KHL92961.1 LysR family transcriptional regulator [Paenibacillus sp. IHB B 3415]
MEFLQLKYFQLTAKHENVTKAAGELFISQPALSKMIRNLETELGVQLFDREGKHIVLNAYGKKFLKRVDQAMYTLEQGVTEVKEMKHEKIEVITLYIAVGSMLLPSIVRQFRDRYPHIRFNLTQHPAQIKKGMDYDFAITSERIEDNEQIVLLEEEILLGVPAAHPLSALNTVALKDLEHEKFISLTTANALRRTTDRFFSNIPYEPDIVFESDDPATVRGLIQSGLGISFIPSVLWNRVVSDDIRLLPISEPLCMRTIYLSWPAGKQFTDTEKSFFEFILQLFRDISASGL